MLLHVLMQHKHNRDMMQASQYVTELVASDSNIQQFLINKRTPDEASVLKPVLQRYINHQPYIASLILHGQFAERLIEVNQSGFEKEQSQSDTSTDFSNKNHNSYDNQSFSLGKLNGEDLGKIKIRWKEGIGNSFQTTIQGTTLLLSGVCFILVFLLSYSVILKRYTKEQNQLTKHLSQLVSHDLSNRLDPRTYSKDIAELSTYINRVLTELEETRKQKLLSQDSCRQLERHQNEAVRHLDKQAKQIELVYTELQEGLNRLFSILSCGLIIIDHEYRIHWSNQTLERLLRFAKLEEDMIHDERLKRCLAPLVRFQTTDRIDDLCAWPQPSLGCAASCRIRAVAVPTQDASKLFFVTVEEDSGFPQQRTPEFFSHRLVLDVLSQLSDEKREESSEFETAENELKNERLWACLSRIERYQEYENDKQGDVKSIRLTGWLQQCIEKNDLYCEALHIVPQTTETDIQLKVQPDRLEEMILSAMEILSHKVEVTGDSVKPVTVRTYLNARGKPVIEWMIPEIEQSDIQYFKEAFGGRRPLYCDQFTEEPVAIGQLEHDIGLTLFQFLRQHFRAYAECMYSAGKHLGIIRLVIERYDFPEKPDMNQVKNDQETPDDQKQKNKDIQIKGILQNFLGKNDSVRFMEEKNIIHPQ